MRSQAPNAEYAIPPVYRSRVFFWSRRLCRGKSQKRRPVGCVFLDAKGEKRVNDSSDLKDPYSLPPPHGNLQTNLKLFLIKIRNKIPTGSISNRLVMYFPGFESRSFNSLANNDNIRTMTLFTKRFIKPRQRILEFSFVGRISRFVADLNQQ